MSEVVGIENDGRERVSLPFTKSHLVPREKLSLDRMPDLELRVVHNETGEVRSELLKVTQKLSSTEAKAVDLDQATTTLVEWLKKRYGSEYKPEYERSWEAMVKWKLIPFLFAERMKHLRPPKSFQSMLEAGPGHEGPQLKLHLNYSRNFYVNSTYYRIPETERNGEGPVFLFEAGYDNDIKYSGAVAGFAQVFNLRQPIIARHRFINLQANFDYKELCAWVTNRINTLLPGVVTKGLIWDFQWLGEGKFFRGDEPWPLKAADARTLANEYKEAV